MAQHPSGLTLSELAKFIMVSNANISGIISRLHKRGLITRKLKPSDRRTTIVKLSNKGLNNWEKMEKAYKKIIALEILKDIPEKDLQNAYKSLSGLNDSLNNLIR